MKIILNQNVENLGSVGDVVSVRPGYGRNYLIPRGFAVSATDSNVRLVEKAKSKEISEERERRSAAEKIAEKIRSLTVTQEMAAGDEGKLFGSVTPTDVQKLLEKEGVEVDKKDIRIPASIRRVGTHSVEIRCHTTVKAALRLRVISTTPVKSVKPVKAAKAEATEVAEVEEGAEKKAAEPKAEKAKDSDKKAKAKKAKA